MVIGVFVMMAVCLEFAYVLLMPTDTFSRKVSGFVYSNILIIGFTLALGAALSSLVYSDIIGYPPCLFCWYARIFFYPQVVIFGVALWKKDRSILNYAMALSGIGLAISTYHYIVESTGYSPLPCAAGGVSCLTRYVYELGFITIPLMSLVGFLTLLLALIIAKRASRIRA